MSRIFTAAEMQEIERRKQGDRKDRQGLFSARIRPKMNELLEVWLPQKKQLEGLIKPIKKQ